MLPIQVWHTQDRGRRWVTERWALRRDKLFLMPGDSPAGFRLPLGSLPVVHAPIDYPHVLPRDPFADAPPLPEREVLMQRRRTVTLEARPLPPSGPSARSTGSVRTALTVEPRDGQRVRVHAAARRRRGLRRAGRRRRGSRPQPPRRRFTSKATRRRTIRASTSSRSRPIPASSRSTSSRRRAGTRPSTSPRRSTRRPISRGSATEKFMLDGRHTGTGGGNHIVLGGMTPADSPFLRRPDLLASIIAYWQNHPSLSYLFSGLFIGPTSQAPRVDEGAPRKRSTNSKSRWRRSPILAAGTVPPWLVDRIFRNLLIDVTGNTHRAEICIDKLYSPDSPTGRLGLVEFRSFEMPPHARMSLAQQLLLRALIVMFWEKPYRQKLVRWGTALHDRFMLPHFIWSDFSRVIDDLKAAGLPVELDWFRPHFEFRFPMLGTVARIRRRAGTAPGARALARAGRGRRRRRHRALRRHLARARAGEGPRPDRRSLRRHLQRPHAAADADRHRRAKRSPASATAPGGRPRRCIRPFRRTCP